MLLNKNLAVLAVVALGTIVAIASYHSQSEADSFLQFKQQFGMKFDAAEDAFRRKVFEETVSKINHHNGLLGTTYKMGINKFSAMTDAEFAETHFSVMPTAPTVVDSDQSTVGVDVDWVAYGAVSPVKDQGSCTATYAFSAVGAIEAGGYIWYRNAVEYSVQQVVDCSSGYGNNGCNNGRMDNTFNYVKDRGINTWAAYPYVGYAQACKTATGVFRIGGYANVTSCTALANALLNIPISVAVDANNWRSYSFGVFSNCGTSVNLAALLVGMTDAYWRVKNSWGTSWGEAGYIRLARGNTCGICSVASYPLK